MYYTNFGKHHVLGSGSETHHRLGSTTLMDVPISSYPTGTHRTYGPTVCALMSILVWKCLELHCLIRVHLFTESQQMECSIWTDLIFHTWDGRAEWLGVDVAHNN